MPRVVAWALLAVVCYGVYTWASGWRNPLAVPVTPITSVMPALPDGCARAKSECL